MFQRYTEKARRVIFFARYEASQYGSPVIETEHILLGLLREDRPLAKLLGGSNVESEIRAEIEKHIEPRERISTSVEMPLSGDCKKVLTKAAEEADRLGQRHIGTEHLLLGLLRVEGSLAAQILQGRGLRLATLREELPRRSSPPSVEPKPGATLGRFLSGLSVLSANELEPLLTENAVVIDVFGKRWNREEIGKGFETLFAPYAKKNAAYVLEDTLIDTNDSFVAAVLWKNAILASMERVWIHRMSVVMVRETEDRWAIAFLQVTPVKPS